MITVRNQAAQDRDLVKNDVWWLTKAGVPGATDGVGIAGPGSLCTDSVAGKLYINTGTKAAPTWVVAGTQT